MNQPKDLEQQLDELTANASDATAQGADVPVSAPTQAPSDGDLVDVVGGEFADQVQRLLDETAAEPVAPAGMAHTDVPAPESDEAIDLDDEEALLQQIDTLLAEAAEDKVFSDTDSLDELTDDVNIAISDKAIAKQDAVAESDEPEASADENDLVLEGDFQSLEELDSEEAAQVGERTSEFVGEDEPLSPAAQAVADELDDDNGDSAIDGDMETLEQTLAEPEELIVSGSDDEAIAEVEAEIEEAPSAADLDDQPEPQPLDAAAQEHSDAAAVASDPKTSFLPRLISALDWPLSGASQQTRNLVGCLAISQVCLALCLLGKAILHPILAGLWIAVMGLAVAAAVYFLMVRPAGDATNSTDPDQAVT